MDCGPYSSFREEKEMLFIGGFAAIPFTSIIRCGDGKNYSKFVRVIRILSSMFAGDRNLDEIIEKDTKRINMLIANYKYNRDNVDAYAIDLFKHFCMNVEYIKFNMKRMKLEVLVEMKKKGKTLYGYKPLYNIFFNQKLDMVELRKILNLFVNVKEITIEKWNTTKYDESMGQLSSELMNYVLEIITIKQPYVFKKLIVALKIPMVEVNDVCTVLHPLVEIVTTRDTFSCDKCEKKCEKKTIMYECDDCNYALCQSCYKSKNISISTLKKSIIKFQPLFQEISWDVQTITTYKNQNGRVCPAICFSAA